MFTIIFTKFYYNFDFELKKKFFNFCKYLCS